MNKKNISYTTSYTIRYSLLVTSLFLVTFAGTVEAKDRAGFVGKHPDLSGTYDVATLTPLQRPKAFGNNLLLTKEQAEKMISAEQALIAAGSQSSDPDRNAPPDGGDGSEGAAGNVGGYNTFWIDRGDEVFTIDGKFRTSIITDPENGRRPALTPAAREKYKKFVSFFRKNKGEAYWMPGPGPYDNMEQRPNAERCLLGFGSTSGPPMFPVLYNNLKRIIQTEDHVMILVEMVHDARIIRLNSEHAPEDERYWMGDSIGHWEGDTLVVDTTNFKDRPALSGASRDLHVIERFTKSKDGGLLYSFTVDDPTTWTASWSGEYPWPVSQDKVFEYACHEGNYALGNIMRGARRLENDYTQTAGKE